MKTRSLTLAELRLSPEYDKRFDVYRRQDGTPVTINCSYGGLFDRPQPYTIDEFSVDEIAAVRRAVQVWQAVCFLEQTEGNRQTDGVIILPGGEVTNWEHANICKSRLLGRMIHDGLPPTRSMPPYYAAGRAWWDMEGGDPFLVEENTPVFAEDCENCNGSGMIIFETPWRQAGIQPTTCRTCNGTGSVRIDDNQLGIWATRHVIEIPLSIDVEAVDYKAANLIAKRAAETFRARILSVHDDSAFMAAAQSDGVVAACTHEPTMRMTDFARES